MSRSSLLVLADDLTGACECALAAVEAGGRAVASLGGPIAGEWDLVAVDLDARDGWGDVGLLAGSPHEAVLKIDSTLRGPIPALVERFAAASGAELLLVAPALPARGRVTRDGFQHLLGSGDAPIDVREALGSARPDTVVLDASDDADLDAGVAWGDASGRRIGWVGSAGLVAALVRARHGIRPAPRAPRLEPGPVVVAVGSVTPQTAAQVEMLASRPDVDAYAASPEPARIAHSLAGGRHALVHGASPDALAAVVAETDRRVRVARLLLTGGATARAVCAAVGVTALEVVGAAGDGTPLSRALGGERWVATKAGRFGPPDALSRAVDRLAGSAA